MSRRSTALWGLGGLLGLVLLLVPARAYSSIEGRGVGWCGVPIYHAVGGETSYYRGASASLQVIPMGPSVGWVRDECAQESRRHAGAGIAIALGMVTTTVTLKRRRRAAADVRGTSFVDPDDHPHQRVT